MNNRERRFVASGDVRIKGDSMTIRGHASTFDDIYNLGAFDERIAPGAFDGVMEDDVRALVNHDMNRLIGRTKSGTLRLSIDERGLMTEIDLPESAVEVRESIKRGDLSQMSFGFTVEQDEWTKRSDDGDRELRTITRIGKLYDVGPCTLPANPNTDVALRSRDHAAALDESATITGDGTGTALPEIKDGEVVTEEDEGLSLDKARMDLAARA